LSRAGTLLALSLAGLTVATPLARQQPC